MSVLIAPLSSYIEQFHIFTTESFHPHNNNNNNNNNNDNNNNDNNNKAQYNAIRTNYVTAKIDKSHQNNRYKLYGDRDETINHSIS